MTWTPCFNEFDPSDIRPPFFGVRGEGAEPHVSVRAVILSLARFGSAAGALERIVFVGIGSHANARVAVTPR